MTTVKNLCLLLEHRPEVALPPGIVLRHFADRPDIAAWLAVRARAFAREKLGVGQWNAADFEREFLSKPWWSPGRMWLAQVTDAAGLSQVVGTVTWADRGRPPDVKAAVHWLAVLPGYRRRGIGRLLLETLHQACWDAGHREIFLETHVAWAGAGRLYTSLGYHAA
jgi:mycothiol synthase